MAGAINCRAGHDPAITLQLYYSIAILLRDSLSKPFSGVQCVQKHRSLWIIDQCLIHDGRSHSVG